MSTTACSRSVNSNSTNVQASTVQGPAIIADIELGGLKFSMRDCAKWQTGVAAARLLCQLVAGVQLLKYWAGKATSDWLAVQTGDGQQLFAGA